MAARALRESGLTIDTVYTSYLKRAIQSKNAILLEMDQAWLPVVRPHKHACYSHVVEYMCKVRT
jgi:bisphosphoglycerate-dependent phosphoglycerate mutase